MNSAALASEFEEMRGSGSVTNTNIFQGDIATSWQHLWAGHAAALIDLVGMCLDFKNNLDFSACE